MMLGEGIKKDMERAKEALESAERNFKEGDILTTANRSFVACENAVYVLLKSKFGSSSISRAKILTRLKEISPEAKIVYDKSYDLRVQADYGREARILPLNKENMEKSLKDVKKIIRDLIKRGIFLYLFLAFFTHPIFYTLSLFHLYQQA